MRFKDYLEEAYKVIKPIKPKPDKKSWNILDPYEQRKLKQWLKQKKISVTSVWRILGKNYAYNLNHEKTVDINFETMAFKPYSVTINLKTGEMYEI
jgi:hypothetical protein